MKTKITVVTPAGRRRYLAILAHYILKDEAIDAWQLWDNCRNEEDRVYINRPARRHGKITVVRADHTDGKNKSINQFYQLCTEPDTLYIKLDDDIVYLSPSFGKRFLSVEALRDDYDLFTAFTVNNAICSWLLQRQSQKLHIDAKLQPLAGCPTGWRDPAFAAVLHKSFLTALMTGRGSFFAVRPQEVPRGRYSINCIGFFGSAVLKLGAQFCPPGTDDEKWLTVDLPDATGKPIFMLGDVNIAHFSYFTQEQFLLARHPELLRTYSALARSAPGRALAHAGFWLKDWSRRFGFRSGTPADYAITSKAPGG